MIQQDFPLLAYSAVQIAQAGPLAAGVLIGMTVAVGRLNGCCQKCSTAMTAGANGFIAFGAAVLIAGADAILSLAAVNLANPGPLAIGCMVGMVAAIAGLALGAAALGPALTAGAVGLVAFVRVIISFQTETAGKCRACHSSRCASDHCAISDSGTGFIATLGAGMIVFGAGAA